ncbi:MAG: hypothetical protein E7467_01785 [Ruminococcaceae bacterium]|nr:hypothetical protein [Oscillospiraceae bacterium]
MLKTQELGLMALVRSALTRRKVELPEGFSLQAVVPMVRKHQIAPIIMQALNYYNLPEQPMFVQAMMPTVAMSLSVFESQNRESEKLFAALQERGIDYAPLKGTLLKKLYPSEDLRSMADVDVLVRTGDREKLDKLMRELGYTSEGESDHEYNWRKGYVHMELHKSPVPSYDREYYAYYGDGWKFFAPIAPKAHRYAMRSEDEYVYLFTHYAKHFRDGGIGVKHLTDLWAFLKAKPDMDREYIRGELRKLHLEKFHENVLAAIACWFDDAPMSETSETILHAILGGAAYGVKEMQQRAEAVRISPNGKSSKLRWTTKKIFLPYKNMCSKYPFLRYLPFLLPIMWVVRWVTAIVCKPKKLSQNVKDAKNMSQESVDEYRAYLDSVGLRFEGKG